MFAHKAPPVIQVGSAGAVDEDTLDELVHDLRGPLSVIVAFAESLDGAQREERARFTERLVVNAHRALAVLEEFAALSDLRADSLDMSLRPTDLAEVIERAAADVRPGLQRGVELICLVPPHGLPMLADPDMLGMAMRAVLRKLGGGLQSPLTLRVQVVADDDLARVELRAGEALPTGEVEILRRVVALHGGRVLLDNDDPGLAVGFCIPRQPR